MWQHEYTCHRCEVTWRADVNENVPDTCWSCEQNDSVTVWSQAGRPVLIPEAHLEAIAKAWSKDSGL